MTPTVPEVPDVATSPHPEPLSDADRLVTRPAGALPTALDPASPQARGAPADPKPEPKLGQGDPDETNPPPGDLGRSA